MNIDKETGIRYGVIPMHEVMQAWCDEAEPHYVPICPHCGNFVLEEFEPQICESCGEEITEDDLDMIEPIAWYVDDGDIHAEQSCDDPDIFVLKSKYFTYCAFCSPCAPGAGYIMDQRDKETGIKAYCFGHDWFDDQAPYRLYYVKTNRPVRRR
jgi:hypothetical protein